MIDRRIVGYLARRGTDSERTQVLFETGELVYTTDTKRVYIGDGTTTGGVPVSNTNSILTYFPITSAIGDLVYRSDLLRTYIATESGFTYIGPYPDDESINFLNNRLQVANNGITYSKLNSDVVASSGGLTATSTGLSINCDPLSLGISDANTLYIQPDAILRILSAINTPLTAAGLTLTNATLSTYTLPVTAKDAFLLMQINGTVQAIQLWDVPI